jgi:asparagine synthase (glutamine-hydrolysing)
MSGIVGIINNDGAPVDRDLLRRMTDFMSYRGPDAQEVWIDGHVGFGHTMLRTTAEQANEHQPFTLDDEVWITADARIDGLAELISKLESAGVKDLDDATDVELILQAYRVWDTGCVNHLIGDFAFAIWDARRRQLFCARDHFGVKPFYYAEVANCVVFSNTLNCVLEHPGVSYEINDQAIGDFLLFGNKQEVTGTTFSDIKRLPAAHYIIWSSHTKHLQRYWNLPTDGHVRFSRDDEYVERFNELFEAAVSDRLRNNKVAVSMSGGLDSTSVAATASKVSSKKSEPLDLRAFTMVYEKLIPDQERYYSGLAAKGLGIPIHYIVLDDYRLYERWDCPELRSPEPDDFPLSALTFDHLKEISAHSRVVLSGDGGDPTLRFSQADLAQQLKSLRIWNASLFIVRYIQTSKRFPRLGFRTKLKRLIKRDSEGPCPFPAWLNQAFTKQFDLPARQRLVNRGPKPVHPVRPDAYNSLIAIYWPDSFERADPGATSIPVEYRYPYFDIRLVSYLLAIPALPWCAQKELVRRAMKGLLPEPVRLRAKAPLAGDPFVQLIGHPEANWIDQFDPVPALTRYVDRTAIPRIDQEKDPLKLWLNTRPISLNYWLKGLRSCEITN